MAAHPKIVDLRHLLAERFPNMPATAAGRLRTGLTQLDIVAGGGLPKTAITELISPHPSAGSALLLSRLLECACMERYFIALIDGRDSFDPQPLGNTRIKNLLWVRCSCAHEAIKAADLLLRDGNFPLVVLDLIFNPAPEVRKIPQTSWYRLQRLVEPTPASCLVMTREGVVSSAQLKIVLENSWTLEQLDCEESISHARFRVQRSHLQQLGTQQPAFV